MGVGWGWVREGGAAENREGRRVGNVRRKGLKRKGGEREEADTELKAKKRRTDKERKRVNDEEGKDE